jgi:ABC-type Fe3+ transport system permease subunit
MVGPMQILILAGTTLVVLFEVLFLRNRVRQGQPAESKTTANAGSKSGGVRRVWIYLFLYFLLLVVDLVFITALGTSANKTFGKQIYP